MKFIAQREAETIAEEVDREGHLTLSRCTKELLRFVWADSDV